MPRAVNTFPPLLCTSLPAGDVSVVDKTSIIRQNDVGCVITWKLYLFLEHQYQPVSSFLLTAAILVYPYLQLKHCLCTLHQ